MKRNAVRPIHPVAKALLVRDWQTAALDAELHAFMGEDSGKMVNAAGRRFYVILGAAVAQGLTAEDADIRVVRGAVNAMGDQAGVEKIDPLRRQSIVSGLVAVRRLLDRIKPTHVGDAAVDLAQRLLSGDVWLSDFQIPAKEAV